MPPQLTNITSDAFPERDAARPTAAFTRSILNALRRIWSQARRRSLRVDLQDLNERELMDIGLTRGEIDYLTPQRAIDTLRDRATDLWSRGGI
jgi:uncharacterized protein YjiS (DUF1127 family)